MLHLGGGQQTRSPGFPEVISTMYAVSAIVIVVSSPLSRVSPFQLSGRGKFRVSILVSTIGKRNVSPRYVSGRKKRKRERRGDEESSRSTDFAFSLHANRLRPPSHLHILHLFFKTSSRRPPPPPPPSFPPHSIFLDASRCLAEIPAVSSSLFSRDGAQEWGRGGRKERVASLAPRLFGRILSIVR